MQVSIQTDKKQKKIKTPTQEEEQYQQADHQYNSYADLEKDRKIKKLTQINRELIQKLKQQNQQLTKKINKQKLKPGRSLSIKNSPRNTKNTKQSQSTKRQLMNAYKQIDMYKSILTNLKAKEISIDSIQKINQLENKIKYEEGVIDQLQKEIKYLGSIKQQQEKQLKVFENDEVKSSVQELEKEVANLKQKLKNMKKTAQKRDQVEKKQHAYQIQLERALRKINDEYYPGKVEQKRNNGQSEDEQEITQRQWQVVKTQLNQLKKTHQENGKKIDHIHRQKNRQLKAAEQNDLKIKEKTRKLQTLKNKLSQLNKLVTVRSSHRDKKGGELEGSNNLSARQDTQEQKLSPQERLQKKGEQARQVKKWMIPQGYCLQKGKIMPDSIFFSDKTLLKDSKKSKIKEVSIWHDNQDNPCLLQFVYQDEKSQQIEGIQPVPNMSNSLELSVFKMKEGDYLHKIRGYFIDGQLTGIHLISKFGKQITIQSQNAKSDGQLFVFEPRPNEIPSCVFGAYVRKNDDEARVCHIGVQFITDW